MKNVGTMEPTTKTWYPYLVVDITAFGDVKRATLICDSGAAVSVVHTNLLRGVKHTVRSMPNRKFVTANGEPIGNKLFASFELVVIGIEKEIKLQDVLIMNSTEAEETHIIMGGADLANTGVLLDFNRGLIKFENDVKKVAPMSRSTMLNVSQMKGKSDVSATYDNKNAVEARKKEGALDFAIEKASGKNKRKHIDFEAVGRNIPAGYKQSSVNRTQNQGSTKPDDGCYRNKMDRLGHAYHKEAVRNYHRSTEKDSGEADVDSMHRQNLTVKTPGEIEIIAVRLDEDFRNGVLVLFEKHGVAIENRSQMMLVEKKTDEGQIHAFSNTRVVVVCNTEITL